MNKSRRDFLDWIIQGGIFTTLAGMILPALAYLWPVTRRGPAGGMKEAATADEIPVWGAKKVILGGSAYLLLRTPTEFRAFSAICTHLGCVVGWDARKKQIACPCHAGFFDASGEVISGPPPRPLARRPVSVMDGKIFIGL
jgi:cytochrome b6-f complex iron-sulfur subunit